MHEHSGASALQKLHVFGHERSVAQGQVEHDHVALAAAEAANEFANGCRRANDLKVGVLAGRCQAEPNRLMIVDDTDANWAVSCLGCDETHLMCSRNGARAAASVTIAVTLRFVVPAQDSYLERSATASTWWVFGNRSNARSRRSV